MSQTAVSSISMAWRFLRRDWRSGELRVLVMSLVIAVAAVSSVGFFTDRIHRALMQQANELLGADLVLSSDHAFEEIYFEKARQLDLTVSENISFPSMVVSADGNQLSMLKAVDKEYPLRGKLRVAQDVFAPDQVTDTVPDAGTVWLAPRLMTSLKVKVGDLVSVGAKDFRVSAILSSEPGAGGGVFGFAPSLMLPLSDLPETQLIQPGSRVRYNFLLSGDPEAITKYRIDVEQGDHTGISVQGVSDARPEIRVALDRAKQFLGLAALASVILAGVAIALAARRFAQRHLDHCAILRCLGAQQKTVTRIFNSQLLMLGLMGSSVGALIGFLTHLVLVDLLGGLVGVTLPMPSVLPAILGVATGMVTLLGFAMPPLLQLARVPALRVLRRELGALGAPGFMSYILGLVVLAALMIIQAGDVKLGAYMVLGSLLGIALLAGVAFGLIQVLRSTREHSVGSFLYGLSNVSRRRTASIVQVVAFGLGIMALLLLTVIRGDLLNEWQGSLPADAPNRFVINIPPADVPKLQTFLDGNELKSASLYPMIRGRLMAINEKAITPETFADDRAKRLAEREFNLSWAADKPADNVILSGAWWSEKETGLQELSVEEGIAKTLNINLGDSMTYRVGGQEFTAKVTSLREVNWDSFKPNFFVMAPPGLLDDFPTTYMTSFYLPADKYRLLNDMLNQFPTVTVIDVAAIMSQVRNIIQRVTMAVEYVFVFTLLAGVMVLFAGIQSTHDERMLENAILRTLGGQKRQITIALLAEFVALGLLAGLMAAGLASVLAYVLAEQVLKVPYHFNAWVWLFGVLGGAIGVGIAGFLGSRSVMNNPPLQTLRKLVF